MTAKIVTLVKPLLARSSIHEMIEMTSTVQCTAALEADYTQGKVQT